MTNFNPVITSPGFPSRISLIQRMGITVFAFYIFISMQPFIAWGQEWLFLVSAGIFFLLFILGYRTTSWSIAELTSLAFVLMFFLYLAFPLREFDGWGIRQFAYAAVLTVALFWFPKNFHYCLNALRTLFFWIVILSIISIFLYLLNVPFPDYVLNQESRAKSTDLYKWYYGMIYLNTQVYDLGIGRLVRNVGVFGEPGHFGIYLCLLLLMEDKPLEGKVNKVLVLGVISTFSAASYAILLLILVLKERFFKQALFFFILFLALYLFNVEWVFSVVLDKFNTGEDLLASREVLDLSLFFHTFSDLMFGYGRDVLNFYGYTSSNLAAFVLRYGVFGFLIFFSFLIFATAIIYMKGKKIAAVTLFIVVLAIISHRSWMIDTLYLWSFIIIAMSTAFLPRNRE